jgi:hypothetical protein
MSGPFKLMLNSSISLRAWRVRWAGERALVAYSICDARRMVMQEAAFEISESGDHGRWLKRREAGGGKGLFQRVQKP